VRACLQARTGARSLGQAFDDVTRLEPQRAHLGVVEWWVAGALEEGEEGMGRKEGEECTCFRSSSNFKITEEVGSPKEDCGWAPVCRRTTGVGEGA